MYLIYPDVHMYFKQSLKFFRKNAVKYKPLNANAILYFFVLIIELQK